MLFPFSSNANVTTNSWSAFTPVNVYPFSIYHAVTSAVVVKSSHLSTTNVSIVYQLFGTILITSASAPYFTVCSSGSISPFHPSSDDVILYLFTSHWAVNTFKVPELTLSTHTVSHHE